MVHIAHIPTFPRADTNLGRVMTVNSMNDPESNRHERSQRQLNARRNLTCQSETGPRNQVFEACCGRNASMAPQSSSAERTLKVSRPTSIAFSYRRSSMQAVITRSLVGASGVIRRNGSIIRGRSGKGTDPGPTQRQCYSTGIQYGILTLETEHSAHLQGSKLNSRAIDPSVAPTSQANDSKSSELQWRNRGVEPSWASLTHWPIKPMSTAKQA